MRSVPVADSAAEGKSKKSSRAVKKPHTRKALELVAMRGRDVIAVRHLLEGGTAWVGNVTDAIARISMNEFGGHPVVIGEVTPKAFALNVPPGARCRVHRTRDLPRLFAGPQKLTLRSGDRAVIVLGPVQIRAQVVDVETFASGMPMTAGAIGWVAFVGAIYIAALGICAALAPSPTPKLGEGAMQRITAPFLSHIALR